MARGSGSARLFTDGAARSPREQIGGTTPDHVDTPAERGSWRDGTGRRRRASCGVVCSSCHWGSSTPPRARRAPTSPGSANGGCPSHFPGSRASPRRSGSACCSSGSATSWCARPFAPSRPRRFSSRCSSARSPSPSGTADHSTGLLYGLPMAAVFARRDWEHAVGAHYTESFIGWLMASVET